MRVEESEFTEKRKELLTTEGDDGWFSIPIRNKLCIIN